MGEWSKELLDAERQSELVEYLIQVGFQDGPAAARCLRRLADDASQRPALLRLLPHLMSALSSAANPDQALVNLERLAQGTAGRERPVERLEAQPRALEILVTLFAGSQFLSEILLRNPEHLGLLINHRRLGQPRSAAALSEMVAAAAACGTIPEQLDALRRFQRQELLRTGAGDLLGLVDLPGVVQQLSQLADNLVQACLEIAAGLADCPPQGFCVIALGKLGGQELNYSSDIDLLFITRSDEAGYRRLGERLIETLARITAEGFLYRVDMRLRPWGNSGSLVSTLDGYLTYLERHARTWEKQALLKARPVAGDMSLGQAFMERIQPRIFGLAPELLRRDIFAMKQRTETYLQQKGRTWGEVKLGAGSIRDVEFVAQFLQLAHGSQHPSIRSAATLPTLERLAQKKLLAAHERRILRDGYIFLRTIEHSLQLMQYQQTNTLPGEAQELARLAQRLGFQGETAAELFLTRYAEYGQAIREIYLRLVGNEPMSPSSSPPPSEILPPQPAADLAQHLKRLDATYAKAFTPAEIQQHADLIERIGRENPVEVVAQSIGPGASGSGQDWQVVIVANDYPGELSLICGLLFVYNLNITSGLVFTYAPLEPRPAPAAPPTAGLRKIVDVLRVQWVNGEPPPDLWQRYRADLAALLQQLATGEGSVAHGDLAQRVALKMSEKSQQRAPLYPIEILFDNTVSAEYTALHINSQDTIGFLYELTNALALRQVYIAQVFVESIGSRVYDTLFVSDAQGSKITDPARQQELRTAILLIKHFSHLLPLSADPESALLHFQDFLGKLFERPNWAEEVASLERPEVLQALAQVLGVSNFLWEDFLRMQYENLFPVVKDVEGLALSKERCQLQSELEHALAASSQEEPDPIFSQHDRLAGGWRAALNAFKDRELFRIDMRQITGHTHAFDQFSQELTDLAEVVVANTSRLCEAELAEQFGVPLQQNGEPCTSAIFALGKCGGRELGFASDIELMFLYGQNGLTSGPRLLSAGEYYEKLVTLFLGALRTRREGIFHVDLQLRPYGKAGTLAVSLAAFTKYFNPEGPAWAYERQALTRLRPIAGSQALGEQVSALRDAFVYTGEPFDVLAMRAMRERQVRHNVGGGIFNAKYSPGGLLDVEYLVQGLQITHGARHPTLRQTNTRAVMIELARLGYLNQEDATRLRRAHTFLRWLIDSLRVVRGNARDLSVPPFGSDEFEFLTRRLQYGKDTRQLRQELARFTSDVIEINNRLLA